MVKPPEKPKAPPAVSKAGGGGAPKQADPRPNAPAPALEIDLEDKSGSGLGLVAQKTTARKKMALRLDKQARLERTIKIERGEGGGLTKFFLFLLLLAGGLYGAERMGFDTISAIEEAAKIAGVKLPDLEEPTAKPQTEFKIQKKQAVQVVDRTGVVPTYAFGDEFVFAHEALNGKGLVINNQEVRYAVVGMVGEKVRWNVSDQANLISSRNPFLGDIEESTIYRQAQGREPSSVGFAGDGLEIFPLTQGAKIELAGTSAGGAGYSCVVGSAEKLNLKAGEFDTVRVDCKTNNGSRSREEVFHYAPSVGYWVARRTTYKEGDVQRTDTYQLVSFKRAK